MSTLFAKVIGLPVSFDSHCAKISDLCFISFAIFFRYSNRSCKDSFDQGMKAFLAASTANFTS